jgi:ATP-dependent DNA helicase RecG
VAETDLRLRGPGDILGTAQSGLPALRLGDLLRDTALVKTARRLAATIMERDPLLREPAHAPLRSLLRDDPDGNRSLG